MIIKSISDNEDEILLGIMRLHNRGMPFDVDPTYSRGSFYKAAVPQPRRRFDIAPASDDVEQATVEALPLADRSVSSVIFDPPFLFIRYRNNGPAYNPKLCQKHARKFHSYWFVFEKQRAEYDFG